MDRRPTYLLLIVFLALAGWVWFQKNQATSNPGSEIPTQEVVPTLEFLFPADQGVVISLRIENRDGDSVALERVGIGWRLTQPHEAEADAGAVEAAASQLTAIPIQNRFPSLSPADAGLAFPAFTFTVGFSDGTFIVALVGDKTPTGNGYYARKGKGEVIVISPDGIDALTGMLDHLPLAATETPTSISLPVSETQTPQSGTIEPPTATKTP